MSKDFIFMRRALDQAKEAYGKGEVPVGAVITLGDEIIAEGHNSPISSNDPSCHAEVNVIRKAARVLENYRLDETSLYVTLEPCIMCCGALIHARIENLIFSTLDPKSGAVVSNGSFLDSDFVNHKVNFSHGPLKNESSELLKRFFKEKRL